MQAALMPAIEMDRALGEVASLGVADSAIEKLRNTATEFAVEYGKDSVEVVKSAYGIKQAFGELSDLELSGLTKTTNVMAAAIKTDANSAKITFPAFTAFTKRSRQCGQSAMGGKSRLTNCNRYNPI